MVRKQKSVTSDGKSDSRNPPADTGVKDKRANDNKDESESISQTVRLDPFKFHETTHAGPKEDKKMKQYSDKYTNNVEMPLYGEAAMSRIYAGRNSFTSEWLAQNGYLMFRLWFLLQTTDDEELERLERKMFTFKDAKQTSSNCDYNRVIIDAKGCKEFLIKFFYLPGSALLDQYRDIGRTILGFGGLKTIKNSHPVLLDRKSCALAYFYTYALDNRIDFNPKVWNDELGQKIAKELGVSQRHYNSFAAYFKYLVGLPGKSSRMTVKFGVDCDVYPNWESPDYLTEILKKYLTYVATRVKDRVNGKPFSSRLLENWRNDYVAFVNSESNLKLYKKAGEIYIDSEYIKVPDPKDKNRTKHIRINPPDPCKPHENISHILLQSSKKKPKIKSNEAVSKPVKYKLQNLEKISGKSKPSSKRSRELPDVDEAVSVKKKRRVLRRIESNNNDDDGSKIVDCSKETEKIDDLHKSKILSKPDRVAVHVEPREDLERTNNPDFSVATFKSKVPTADDSNIFKEEESIDFGIEERYDSPSTITSKSVPDFIPNTGLIEQTIDQNLNASILPTFPTDWTNNAWSNVIPKILQIELVQQLDTSAFTAASNPSRSSSQYDTTSTAGTLPDEITIVGEVLKQETSVPDSTAQAQSKNSENKKRKRDDDELDKKTKKKRTESFLAHMGQIMEGLSEKRRKRLEREISDLVFKAEEEEMNDDL